MPQQPVDFDALAQQHGGAAVVDYDALAAQSGGSSAPSMNFAMVNGQRVPIGDQIKQGLVQGIKDTPVPVIGLSIPQITDLAKKYWANGPEAVAQGIRDAYHGNYTKGAHEALGGAVVTSLPLTGPLALEAAAAAPMAALATAGTAAAGQQMASRGASALGATPDQAALAGDVGGALGGTVGAKVIAPSLEAALANRAERGVASRTLKAFADFRSAVPATKSAPYTPDDLIKTRAYLEAEHANAPITSVEGLRDAADSAITQIEEKVGSYIQTNPKDVITTDPLWAAKRTLAQSPRSSATDAGLRELSDLKLDGPITIERADEIRHLLNAENKAILKRNNYDIATARTADPGFAAREAAANSLREGIYGRLESRGIGGVADLRRDEGALIQVRNAAQRQVFSGDKLVPGSAGNATARKLASTAIRSTPLPAIVADPLAAAVGPRNISRDEMISRAFRETFTQPPRYPSVPDRPPIQGLLGGGPVVTPHPADTSFVRGVPAEVAQRPVRGLLGKGATILPPPADESAVTGASAARGLVVRDPTTGRFKRVYTSESHP